MIKSLFSNRVSPNKCPIKPVVLLSLDGWGIAPPSEGNAIIQAKTPNMDNFRNEYLYSELIASGESVGLPANEVGNSEVGHLMMGVGKVIYQSLTRIDRSIDNGTFYMNEAFEQAYQHTLKHGSKLHIMGLTGSGNVHSSAGHLFALIDWCERKVLRDVQFHLFTDGRDAPPNDGIEVIRKVEEKLKSKKVGQIATIAGRYWAMDRDARWERIERTYNALVMGKGNTFPSAVEAMQASYDAGKTDEFVEPCKIAPNNSPNADNFNVINDKDAVIFFNFRVDRARELSMSFVLPGFENLKSVEWGFEPDQGTKDQNISKGNTFAREKVLKDLFFVTMTEYQKNLPVSAIAFPFEKATSSLAGVVSAHGLKQMHMAESEKERMVTYYFDGMTDERFENEDVLIIPSPKVETYDKKPEMSVRELVDEFRRQLAYCKYHFFMLNFANPDMVAHTGNLPATIRAIEIVDKAVGDLVNAVLAYDGTVFITADHGNAEELITYKNSTFYFTSDRGSKNTDHSNNPIPLYVISNEFRNQKEVRLKRGSLSDVAPTILTYMKLPVPIEMTGKNLLSNS